MIRQTQDEERVMLLIDKIEQRAWRNRRGTDEQRYLLQDLDVIADQATTLRVLIRNMIGGGG